MKKLLVGRVYKPKSTIQAPKPSKWAITRYIVNTRYKKLYFDNINSIIYMYINTQIKQSIAEVRRLALPQAKKEYNTCMLS